jgi:hypothetical protein
MQIPVLSILILIFILWFQYEIRKNNKLTNKNSNKFWKAEQEANLTRRKDITNLDYIVIPLERLPMEDSDDLTLNSYRDTIRKLSDKKILNLTGQTNRELKLNYGSANFNYLMECDNNYITFISMLHKWGDRFYNLGLRDEAVSILEYAVTCSTDVHKTYRLLAHIYLEQGVPDKIEELITIISSSNMFQKEELRKELTRLKISYELD